MLQIAADPQTRRQQLRLILFLLLTLQHRLAGPQGDIPGGETCNMPAEQLQPGPVSVFPLLAGFRWSSGRRLPMDPKRRELLVRDFIAYPGDASRLWSPSSCGSDRDGCGAVRRHQPADNHSLDFLVPPRAARGSPSCSSSGWPGL
ncbi:hypothetical protein EPR50_G00091890 [Perca flavescens]|uniref:Secreted protein n=1 Tax=Perca flavescens TaxID=8167 RepID=A0A484D577_PERFV|nr:hypothetical protein EPR50_G00091890 [Perca flavescens]